MPRRKKAGLLEDLIELMSMLPWWLGVLFAPVSYFFAHAWAARAAGEIASKPQVTSGIFYALGTAGQYLLPFICLAGAGVSAYRRHRRKGLADNVAAAKTQDVLGDMSWREFEKLVGEGFRRKGYAVEELGGGGPDGGIDLVLRKDGEKHLVQCKQWRSYKVGVQVVRELYGVMAAEGAAGGIVVTSGRFTDEARTFAHGRNINLLDGGALFGLIQSASKNAERKEPRMTAEPAKPFIATARTATPEEPYRAPACPKCMGAMVRRTARKGANAGSSFWGCAAYPRCRGTAA